jgi:hypothetical protein
MNLSSNTLLRAFAFLLWALAASACVKYEDGPWMSLRSKTARVANTWDADFVFRNQLDETIDYELYQLDFTKEGRLTWRIQPRGGTLAEIGAAWELASVNEQIKITFDAKDPLTGETRLLYADIRRLKENEMWLYFLQNGDYYELRLSPR